MPHTPLDAILCHVRRLASDPAQEDATDQSLLRRFIHERDEAAFAQLVRRHGPMVLGVCRRVLRDPHAADDVFQATFLALARRPWSIRNRASVAGWLHQVAHRIAKRTRFASARRRVYELRSPARAMSDTRDEMMWREMCEVLDAELQALPNTFRAPLVLCYLEGLTRDEAARKLGWTVGEVKGRLERGREMLRRRLTRRGITLSAALLGTLLTQDAASAVSGLLTVATVRAALSHVTGLSTGLSPSVASLADGAIQAIMLARLKALALVVLLICAAAGTGLWVLGEATRTEELIAQTASLVPSTTEGQDTVRADHFGDSLPAGAVARMGTARLRHASSAFFVAFLPDGKQVLSAGEDGFARLWDVATGKEVRRFGTPRDIPSVSTAVALSPDGKTVATCNGDDGVHLWDTATGREVGQAPLLRPDPVAVGLTGRGTFDAERLKELKRVFALAFSPDGKILAAAGAVSEVVLWDLAKRAEVRRLDGQPFNSDEDLRRSVTLKKLSMVRAPNGPAGGGAGIWSEREIPHLAFSNDGRTVLLATLGFRDRRIGTAFELWDAATGKQLRHWYTNGGDKAFMISVALSLDGKAIAWGDDIGNVHLMDAATGKELYLFPSEKPSLESGRRWQGLSSGRIHTRFAFAPNGRTLITQAVGSPAFVVWDMKTGKEQRRVGEASPVPTWPAGTSILLPPGLAVSPDGKTLATAGDGNAVTLYYMATGREIHARAGHSAAVTAVRYSPEGRILTSVGGDGSIGNWEANGGREINRARLPDSTVTSVLSSDGRLVASSIGDGKVRLTETATGKEQRIIPMSNPAALRLALSPDGKTLAAGMDATSIVRLYDIATGKELKALRPEGENQEHPPRAGIYMPFRCAAPPVFSADGRLLAAPVRGALDVWDVGAGRPFRRIALPEDRALAAAVFTPDNRSVAVDIEEGTIALWELATGKVRRMYGTKSSQFTGHQMPGAPPGFPLPIPTTDPVLLDISPDGRLLAHSRGREVRVWDIGSAKELGRLRGHQGAVLTGTFAPDSKRLTTAGADTTALVWDLNALSRGAASARALTIADRETAEKALAGEDAVKAFDTILLLAAAPRQTVPLLRESLKPALPVDGKHVEGLIADLDSADFNKRENATKRLEKLGEQVEPALRKALEGTPPLETRLRVEALLQKSSDLWHNPSPERIRTLRSLEVLERAGTAEAQQVLEVLARGAQGARLTAEAKAASERLANPKFSREP